MSSKLSLFFCPLNVYLCIVLVSTSQIQKSTGAKGKGRKSPNNKDTGTSSISHSSKEELDYDLVGAIHDTLKENIQRKVQRLF